MTTIMEKLGKSVEKVLGTKSNIKKIVKDIETDKAFMKKYENAKTDKTKKQLLKEKVSQIIEKEFEDVKERAKSKLKGALKTIIVFPSSRWITTNSANYKNLPENIQKNIFPNMNILKKPDGKVITWRHPWFNIWMDISKKDKETGEQIFKLIWKNWISIFVAPYWSSWYSGLIYPLTQAYRTKNEKDDYTNDEYKWKKNEAIADMIIAKWLRIKEEQVSKLYKNVNDLKLIRSAIINKLWEAEYKDLKRDKNEIDKLWAKHPAYIISELILTKKKMEDIKMNVSNYDRTYYKWVFYNEGDIEDKKKEDKENNYELLEIIEDSTKPEYVKKMLNKVVPYLLSLKVKYRDIDGKEKVKKLLSVIDLHNILNTVLNELRWSLIIEEFPEVEEIIKNAIQDIEVLIDKTNLKEYKDTSLEELLTNKDNIPDINNEEKEKNKIEVKKNNKDSDKSYLKYNWYKFRVFWWVDGDKRYLIMDINKNWKTEKIEIIPSMIWLGKVFKEYLDKVVNGEEEITLWFIILLIEDIVNWKAIQSSVNTLKTEKWVDNTEEQQEKTQQVSKEKVNKTKKTQQKDIEKKTNMLAGMWKTETKAKAKTKAKTKAKK